MKNFVLAVALGTVLTVGAFAKDKKKVPPQDPKVHYSICVQSTDGQGCSKMLFSLKEAEGLLIFMLNAPIPGEYYAAIYDWSTESYVTQQQLQNDLVIPKPGAEPQAVPQKTEQHVQEHPGEQRLVETGLELVGHQEEVEVGALERVADVPTLQARVEPRAGFGERLVPGFRIVHLAGERH